MRWRRVIEYDGPKEWVERTLANSIHGTIDVSGGCGQDPIIITEVSSQEVTEHDSDNRVG